MHEKINIIENKLAKLNVPDEVKRKNLILKSKVRSVKSSLAIENINVPVENVERIDNNKRVLDDKSDVIAVKNALNLYNNTNEYNYLSEADLIKAHSVLMKYFEDDNDSYRNHGEGVKDGDDIIFIAPDSILVPSLMKNLFEFLNKNNGKIHPIILSAIFHYYLVYIHPFTDGNGRLSRFWMSLILKKYNIKFMYIPFEDELYEEKNEYFKSIRESHNNSNCNSFIWFILNAIEKTIDSVIM